MKAKLSIFAWSLIFVDKNYLNWNDSWYFVVTVFSWFFEICEKNDNEAKIYPTWECKEANFDFSFRKGQFPSYCNCKLSYLFHSTLSQLDRRRMFFILFTEKKTISGFWQTFFSSFGMEVIEESDPGESIGLKFISSQSELFRFIPISVSEPMRIIRLNPIDSETSIQMNPN